MYGPSNQKPNLLGTPKATIFRSTYISWQARNIFHTVYNPREETETKEQNSYPTKTN